MQLHNRLTTFTALLRAFQKALGEERRDAFSGIERAGETLTPVVDLWSRPEWAFLRGEFIWAARTNQAAGGAGTNSKCGLINNSADQIVVVVQHAIEFFGANAARLQRDGTALTAGTQAVRLDYRVAAAPTPVGAPTTQTAADAVASGNTAFEIQSTGAETHYVVIPVLLMPGDAFHWRSTNANVQLGVSFVGYTRRALPGELETL